ncbi:PREDICTED: uncharacterized protein LOC104759753 [Camelina sativa]|uniref:Uncharacterized protein LOC104759753 n=1 Tax=Camelina sativa TaxID=90675 RepID=A0ABM0X5B5_CAMSA|nr:PREDICTED: uncharacterized protein LOC104759753 [Camelina sativa]
MIQGRVCTFIIDLGCCRNIIAEAAVDKLGLVHEQHPAPYNLGWLREGVEMRISQHALLPFSIGQYHCDRTYCDVASIDMSHLLLGCPWEFDCKITHDDAQNMYSFIWETHHVLLLPSRDHFLTPPRMLVPPTTHTLPKSSSTMLCSEATFSTEFRQEALAYAMLATQPMSVFSATLSPELSTVLQKFDDVFPTELPAALPLLRDILHHIDFVPGATLPNRPHYHMSPHEQEELWRQVEDLLRNG